MTKHSPFRYFKTSPEVIRLAVMMYVRFPLSLRNVEDLLHERGLDVSHETVRFWWNRFGPMFAIRDCEKKTQSCRNSSPSTLQFRTISISNAISIHASISSWTVPLLSLSGVNYWAHRFRLCQKSDACSHLFGSTISCTIDCSAK